MFFYRSVELLIIDYEANLRSYLVSPTDGYEENHRFSFAEHYPHGITAVTYDAVHNMLFIAGPTFLKTPDNIKVLCDSFNTIYWKGGVTWNLFPSVVDVSAMGR